MKSGARSVFRALDAIAVLSLAGVMGVQPSALGQTVVLGSSASATNPQRSGDASTGFYSDTSQTIQFSAGSNKVMSIGPNGYLSINSQPTLWTDGSGDLVIGNSTFNQYAGSSAQGNTAIGAAALNEGQSAQGNVAIGANAERYIATGQYNIAIGTYAVEGVCNNNGGCWESASMNVGIGQNALQNVSSASQNIAIGNGTMQNASTAQNNVAIGYNALISDQTAWWNTAIGYQAGLTVTGGNNTIIGAAVGSQTLTSGSQNILIGTNKNVDTPISSTSNFMNIGNLIFGTGMTGTLQAPAGNVGIGTASPTHTLSVNGTIGAQEIIVASSGADYVFDSRYRLAPLREVAGYIEQNHHLPGIPAADEIQANGMGLGEMQAKLLGKIEELTLHMIQAEKDRDILAMQNRELRDRLDNLEATTTPNH